MRLNRLTRLGLPLFALVVVAACGCGEAKRMPVSGKVLLDGKAINGEKPFMAGVNFHPDASKGNQDKDVPAAPVGADGQYTLAAGGKPGVSPGWYKVTVSYSAAKNPKDEYSPRKSLIATTFQDPKTTPLSVEVKEGAAADAYDLKVSK